MGLEPLVLMSDRGHRKYTQYLDAPAAKCIQTMLDGDRVWYIGIPGRGDMTALENNCKTRGVELTHTSWRP